MEDQSYASNTSSSSSKGRNWLWILLVIILVAGAAGGVYYWQQSVARNKAAQQQAEIDSLNSKIAELNKKVEESAKTSSTSNNTDLKEYSDSNISFKYPKEWGEVKLLQLSSFPKGTLTALEVNGISLLVSDRSNTQVVVSFNAPYSCLLQTQNNSWQPEGSTPPAKCDPQKYVLEQIQFDGFSRGSLGAYGYYYIGKIKNNTMLMFFDDIMADGKNTQPDKYPNDAEREAMKASLEKNTKVLVSLNKNLFE